MIVESIVLLQIPTCSQAINSGPIPPNGGSFIHTFAKPGVYEYYDSSGPSAHARITVGSGMETGENMNMLIGGNAIPFNPTHAQRVVLSLVPKTIKIPPTTCYYIQIIWFLSTSTSYSLNSILHNILF